MKRHSRRGQTLVESALALAVFLGLVLGIVDVAQTLFERQMLAERVQEAARWGAMHSYDAGAIRNVVLYGAPQSGNGVTAVLGLTADAVQVANPGCPGTDCRISVAVAGRGVRCVEPVQ
jgi:Flp pilus assembly protein TadG